MLFYDLRWGEKVPEMPLGIIPFLPSSVGKDGSVVLAGVWLMTTHRSSCLPITREPSLQAVGCARWAEDVWFSGGRVHETGRPIP